VNPISFLKQIMTDPVELAGVTLPSAALVAGLFAYREQIDADLRLVPDPTTGNWLGIVIFIVATLTISIIVKRVSHDVLNWMYDKLARPRKLRASENTWFEIADTVGLLTKDPHLSKYEEAVKQLHKLHDPVLPQVIMFQVQSKLARSITLFLIMFAVLWGPFNWLLGVCSMFAAWFMWRIFCSLRWQAAEAAYGALYHARRKTAQ
jgi:hypothetical protein